MLLQFFVNCQIKLIETDIFMPEAISEKTLNKYFSYVLKRYSDGNPKEFDPFRKEFIDLLNKLSRISVPCNMLAGNTISLNDFVILIATAVIYCIDFLQQYMNIHIAILVVVVATAELIIFGISFAEYLIGR